MARNKDDLTKKQWEEILLKHEHKCAYCGMEQTEHKARYSQSLHQEHVIPISKGGKLTKNNVVPSCLPCNSSKSNRNVGDWLSGEKINMKAHSVPLYPSTHKKYMELKNELKLTHDEMIKQLIELLKEDKSE